MTCGEDTPVVLKEILSAIIFSNIEVWLDGINFFYSYRKRNESNAPNFPSFLSQNRGSDGDYYGKSFLVPIHPFTVTGGILAPSYAGLS